MALVESPFDHYHQHQQQYMNSLDYNDHSQTPDFIHSPSPSSSSTTASDSEDEDLLNALFGSDTFSLESGRDRDLISLGNLLEISLGASSRGNSPTNSYVTLGGYGPQMAGMQKGSMTGQGIDECGSTDRFGRFDQTDSYHSASQSFNQSSQSNPTHPPIQTTPHSLPMDLPSIQDDYIYSIPSTNYHQQHQQHQQQQSTNSGENISYSTQDWSRSGGRSGSDSYYPSRTPSTPSSSYTATSSFHYNRSSVGGGGESLGIRAPAVSRERGKDELPSYHQCVEIGRRAQYEQEEGDIDEGNYEMQE